MVEVNKEQVEEMQEKLSKMSPEELKEFQKQKCIFCQIISGKVASKKIYSDDICTAMLDINPANPGHILIIPNEHYGIMQLIPADELRHLFIVAKALAQASLKALETQGTNIFVANGLAAGQKAQHFMIHVIPRKEGDDMKLEIPENKISDSDMKQVIERLKQTAGKALGKPVSEEAVEEVKEEEPEEEVEEIDEEEPKKKKPKKKPAKKKAEKKKTAKKKPAKKKDEKPVTLDDISNLLTGGAQ